LINTDKIIRGAANISNKIIGSVIVILHDYLEGESLVWDLYMVIFFFPGWSPFCYYIIRWRSSADGKIVRTFHVDGLAQENLDEGLVGHIPLVGHRKTALAPPLLGQILGKE
jgi:hypothetical protein